MKNRKVRIISIILQNYSFYYILQKKNDKSIFFHETLQTLLPCMTQMALESISLSL